MRSVWTRALSAACLCVVGCCGVVHADSVASGGHGHGGAPQSGLAARLQQYFERDWLSLALAFESRPDGSRCGAAPPSLCVRCVWPSPSTRLREVGGERGASETKGRRLLMESAGLCAGSWYNKCEMPSGCRKASRSPHFLEAQAPHKGRLPTACQARTSREEPFRQLGSSCPQGCGSQSSWFLALSLFGTFSCGAL
jgi:hypothetical protein